MRLGVDFGTTRIVIAAADRGNYPILTFEGPEGESFDWYPSLAAVRGEERQFGWDAWKAQNEPGWTVLRSLKRLLEDAGPQTRLEVAGHVFALGDLLVRMAGRLKHDLLEHSSLRARPEEPLEIMLGVPANANSNQRFLTVDAFQRAGFSVLGLLNEPSAASIEFGHRERAARDNRPPARILVYDLGGGTFDVSLVELDEQTHSVLASEGIGTLGGDDFDGILADLALSSAGVGSEERETLSPAEWFRLHEECRQRKEALHPNTRRIMVDLGVAREEWREVPVATADFYDLCRPLLDESVSVVNDVLRKASVDEQNALEALYVTGGASELPLVARVLREQFGRKVRRSAYTRSATAIGLAIQADASSGYVLRDLLTRHFGVWREGDGGALVVFDPLFPRGARLPGAGEKPLVNRRVYRPVHNIGHFRYLECSQLACGGQPAGDIAVWDEIRFPFDPALAAESDLAAVTVGYSATAWAQEVEEQYTCDARGGITVTIRNLTAGYERDCRLARWAPKEIPFKPGRKKKTPSK
ncbi:MAG: Hsp70 family protein [Bryobacteraceae bacterium]